MVRNWPFDVRDLICFCFVCFYFCPLHRDWLPPHVGETDSSSLIGLIREQIDVQSCRSQPTGWCWCLSQEINLWEISWNEFSSPVVVCLTFTGHSGKIPPSCTHFMVYKQHSVRRAWAERRKNERWREIRREVKSKMPEGKWNEGEKKAVREWRLEKWRGQERWGRGCLR